MAGKLGHLLLFFVLEKAVTEKKKSLTAYRKSPSHYQHPFLIPSFKTTLSLFVIHCSAKPQFQLIGLEIKTIKCPHLITAR